MDSRKGAGKFTREPVALKIAFAIAVVFLWTRKMFATAALFALMGLTACTQADPPRPCHTPSMTGITFVMNMHGEIRAYGSFTYDSTGKKLRFKSSDNGNMNVSLCLDLLMFFEQGIFYEIDSKNQTCAKKTLHSTLHPMDIPDDARFLGNFQIGSSSIQGEGMKCSGWMGPMTDLKGHYSMTATMGCLPISTFYFTQSTTLLFSNNDIKMEIKDPDLLMVPSFCQGVTLEDTPKGTINSFLHEFL